MSNISQCGACRHWSDGMCWRYPPTLVLWPNDNQHPVLYTPVSSRPVVAAEDRACGEFERRADDGLPW